MSYTQRQVHLGFTEERFPAATHMCYIFSDEQERRQIIAQFMKSGAESAEKIGYFADRISKEELKFGLEQLGVDTSALEASGQWFVETAERVYCPDTRFCSCRMLDLLRNSYQNAMREGYAGLRLSGEMDWVLAAPERSRELLVYEARVNEVVNSHPVTAICQYDAHRFPGELLHQVLEVHPYMLVRGNVVRNPYYIKPESLAVSEPVTEAAS